MKRIILKIIPIAIAVAALALSLHEIQKLKEENIRLKGNQEALLTQRQVIIAESQIYKVSDSLNAAKTSELRFTLKEYKRYRTQDLRLIEQLEIRGSNLQKVIDTQAETISVLSAKLNTYTRADTASDVSDTLKCFDYKSKWVDVSGCIDLRRDSVGLQINNRESLKVVETVTYKRFLGFLWKTNKIKSRNVDVVSENPSTIITGLDYINVMK